MFIKNALNIKNNIFRYALGIFVIFIFTQIGAIPFIVTIFNYENFTNVDIYLL